MTSITISSQDSNNEVSFFTKQDDGESGMTVTALAKFCGVAQPVITNLLNRLRDYDPISNDLSKSLKPFAGIEQRLISNKADYSLYVKDELCHAILQYYTFEARDYQGKDVAIQNYQTFAKAGVRVFIWSQTGYEPSQPKRSVEIPKPDPKVLAYFENSLEDAKHVGNRYDILRENRKLTDYLAQFTVTNPDNSSNISRAKLNPVKPVVDARKLRIFEDLIKVCKGQSKKVSDLRTQSLVRRKDALALYGQKQTKFLRKLGIVAMLTDAAKYGYGTFDEVINVFSPNQ